MNPMATVSKGKGFPGVLRRAWTLAGRYGLTRTPMTQRIERFAEILRRCGCGATFPVTADTLAAANGFTASHLADRIEFAVHGCRHVDHTHLPREKQLEFLQRALRVFAGRGIVPRGFRAPYLRWNDDTLAVVGEAGLLYDASWALAWESTLVAETPEYRRALSFYRSASAMDYPSLPRWDGGVVRIPYNLPDDEALVERLNLRTEDSMNRIWTEMLDKTYRLGELFCLGLHPERIYLCEPALAATLQRASAMKPSVWIARLEEVATWWVARTRAEVAITEKDDGRIHVSVRGPHGLVILSRGVEVENAMVEPWFKRVRILRVSEFDIRTRRRPFVGVSPSSSPRLMDFLRQQGYILEEAENGLNHAFFLDRPNFEETDERALLGEIERGGFPLVWLGRWPYGARSALCVTGDLDAFSLWDYAARLLPD